MEKIKNKLIDLKLWYLLKWKTHKKPMILIHIFFLIVLIGEIISWSILVYPNLIRLTYREVERTWTEDSLKCWTTPVESTEDQCTSIQRIARFTKIKKSRENQIPLICKESRRTYIATIPVTVTTWSRHLSKRDSPVWVSPTHSSMSIPVTYIQTKTPTSFGRTNTVGSTIWIRKNSRTPMSENSY